MKFMKLAILVTSMFLLSVYISSIVVAICDDDIVIESANAKMIDLLGDDDFFQYYTVNEINRGLSGYTFVEYSFTGPGALNSGYNYIKFADNGSCSLNFVNSWYVESYEYNNLLNSSEAEKIALNAGYNVDFENLTLISNSANGNMVYSPGYQGTNLNDRYQGVKINAIDGSLSLSSIARAAGETQGECSTKEDCYPEGFVPEKCGNFYSCIEGKCASGSNSCVAPKNVSDNNIACTMDAKICPDGSAVGRKGPKCEFEACPNATNNYAAPPKEARSCEQDSDCRIVDKDISCCSTCGKADYSSNQFIAINVSWYQNNLDCAAVSCMACISENNPENEKWEAKCLMNECMKVKTVQDDCTVDSDCKLIYGGCGCQAVSILDQRDSLDEGNMQCIWNSCLGMNVTAICKDNKCLRSNDDQIRTLKLSSGRNATIKIMPETASAKAIERLGELGFNITLKEVGNGNETKAVYLIKTSKEARIFGFIKKNASIEMEIDAENDGKIISIKKPWWAFVASGI